MAGKQRGRESAGDMIRSLGLVLGIVAVAFFLAQPPKSDAKRIRVVDPAGDTRAFAQSVPGGAVPRPMPAGWKATVSVYDPDSQLLRIGWVTPADHYVEYAAQPRPTSAFVGDITGHAPAVGTVQIGDGSWTQYRQDGVISLVRQYGDTTVVLGTLRDTGTLDELRVLAGRLSG
jgi:hypothetical protein